ncbi:hypothetical protein L1887_31731 [Cichorium endivia]|nr:hypothetical protein L1887_31731 [Cichorium endivia]
MLRAGFRVRKKGMDEDGVKMTGSRHGGNPAIGFSTRWQSRFFVIISHTSLSLSRVLPKRLPSLAVSSPSSYPFDHRNPIIGITSATVAVKLRCGPLFTRPEVLAPPSPLSPSTLYTSHASFIIVAGVIDLLARLTTGISSP